MIVTMRTKSILEEQKKKKPGRVEERIFMLISFLMYALIWREM